MTDYFFVDPIINLDLIKDNKFLKKLSESELISLLTLTIERLNDVSDWSELNELLQKSGKKPAEFFSLIRLAVSFAPFSPALHQTLSVLGQNRVLARLNAVRTALANS